MARLVFEELIRAESTLNVLVEEWIEIMLDDIETLLTDPDRFFEGRDHDPSLRGPLLVMLTIAVISAITVGVMILTFMEATPADVRIFLLIGGIIGIVIGAIGPFVTWLLYALAFHVITYFFDGEGEFRDTFALIGWGFVPRVFSALLSLVITIYVTQSIAFPADPSAFAAYTSEISTHPINQVASGIGILFTLWSAYIWISAVEHARDVTRGQAAIAVAIPVVIGVLLTAAGILFSGAV